MGHYMLESNGALYAGVQWGMEGSRLELGFGVELGLESRPLKGGLEALKGEVFELSSYHTRLPHGRPWSRTQL